LAFSVGSAIISVSAGSIDAQIFSGAGGGIQFTQANHCRTINGLARILDFKALDTGALEFNTSNSTVRTALAVYRGTDLATMVFEGCDAGSDLGGLVSRVKVQAAKGGNYVAVVEIESPTQTPNPIVHLNWSLQPVLTIAKVGAEVEVRWPTPSQDPNLFVLEHTNALPVSPTQPWSSAGPPTSAGGTNSARFNTQGQARQFYRLRKR
jgi:hypothetical protein